MSNKIDDKLKENIKRFIICHERRHICNGCIYENKCYDELASYEVSFTDNVIAFLRKISE